MCGLQTIHARLVVATLPAIFGHSFGNLTFFLSLVSGVTSH
jgi:hypothetical protein